MTIIKNASATRHYPFQMIDEEVINDLRAAMEGLPSVEALLKVLEAFCHLSSQRLSNVILKSEAFERIAREFIAVLADDYLLGGTADYHTRLAGTFGQGIRALHASGKITFSIDKEDCYPKKNICYLTINTSLIDTDTLRYWSGWAVQSRKGKISYIAIPSLWNKFGMEFAESVYTNFKNNYEKMARPETTEINKLIDFICRENSPWTPSSFQCPIQIRELFTSFMVEWFTEAASQRRDLYGYIRRYSKFIHFLNEAFLVGGIWAKPFLGELPAPSSHGHNQQSNIRIASDGQVVNQKLITPIPLHLTDASALEIIFSRIRTDVTLVHQWALNRVKKLRKAQLLRDRLGKRGTPIAPGRRPLEDLEKINPENLAATLDVYGIEYIRTTLASRSNFKHRVQRRQISSCLALPRAEDIIAFKFLLIHHSQNLTATALDELELFDKNGNLAGFIRTNHGYQLVTYKDRRGAKRSQTFTDLPPRMAVLVQQLIEITTPLRMQLKKDGSDDWRLLFLYSPRELSYSSDCPGPNMNKRNPNWLSTFTQELTCLSERPALDIENLAQRVTFTNYRASCAVANYLNHKDLKTFAQALGHSEYRPSLIKKYLPEPILDFLQSRWIRIFQKGLLCLALQDSPKLLKASKFQSIDELHDFLQAHALGEIPKHLQHAESKTSPDNQGSKKILISVSPSILNILQTVETYVREEPLTWGNNGIARYWADFSRLLSMEIENNWDKSLKKHLKAAQLTHQPIDISNVFKKK